MIRLAELSYHLPQGFLYKNISMFLDRGDKIGLTGKNGVGKSTLLKLIHGDITPTEGAVIREKNLKRIFQPVNTLNAAMWRLKN